MNSPAGSLPDTGPVGRPGMLQSAATVAVGLMVSLPFLYPTHTYPIPTFFEEAFAFAAGLVAFACVLLGTRSGVVVPGICAWIAALSGYILLQPQWMDLAYAEPAQIAALYVVWAAAMAVTGANLRLALGAQRLASILAGALLLSALLSAGAGMLQALDLSSAFTGIIAPSQRGAVYGNLAQRNLFANHLVIGAACLGYLWSARRVSLVPALACALLLAHGIDASGSRASLLMLVWLVAWAGWQSWRADREAEAQRFFYAVIAVVVGVAMFGLLAEPAVGMIGSASTRLLHAGGASGDPPVRLGIYEAALRIWLSAPFFGVGFGGFSTAHYVTATPWVGAVPMNPETNAHNIILHLLAETGIAGTGILVGGFALWFARIVGRNLPLAQAWAVAIVVAEFVHSLVEFPLWYSPFLGVAALLAGFADPKGLALRSSLAAKGLALGVLVIGGALVAQTTWTYLKIGFWGSVVPQEMRSAPEVRLQEQKVIAESRRSLLRPYVDLGLAFSLRATRDGLDAKLALNSRVLRFWQVYPLVENQIALLAMAGRDAEALRLLDHLGRLQPQYLPDLAAFIDTLPDSELASESPLRRSVASLVHGP